MEDTLHFEDRVFENERREVDGLTFERCTFRRCKVVLAATASARFLDCMFVECEWSFAGSAATTLDDVDALGRGLDPGGRELVEGLFRAILDGSFGPEPVVVVPELTPAGAR